MAQNFNNSSGDSRRRASSSGNRSDSRRGNGKYRDGGERRWQRGDSNGRHNGRSYDRDRRGRRDDARGERYSDRDDYRKNRSYRGDRGEGDGRRWSQRSEDYRGVRSYNRRDHNSDTYGGSDSTRRGGGYKERDYQRRDRDGYVGNWDRRHNRYDRGRSDSWHDDTRGERRRGGQFDRDYSRDGSRNRFDDSRDRRSSGNHQRNSDRWNRNGNGDRWNRGGSRDDRRGGWRSDAHEGGSVRRHSPRGGAGREEQFRERAPQLEVPESITLDSLDPQTRAHLRSLNAENAERVGRHLAYAGEMLDIDPEVAYAHAKAAYASAARIDIVREAVGIAAYITGRYSEALSELRTYRRMSDDYSHVAIEADAERGLGRSEKALRFIEGIPLNKLDPEAKVELAIVTSGARADVGNSEGGLSVLEKIKVDNLKPELAARVELVIADRYDELGRADEAQAIRLKWAPVYDDADAGDMLVDLADVLDDEASEEITEATDGDVLAAVHADDDAHEHDELSLDGEPDADDFTEADDSDDLVRETASDDSDDASPVFVDDHEFEDEFDDEFEDDFGGDFEDESDGLDSAEHIVSDTDAPVQDTLWDSLDDSGSDWDSESDR